MTKSKLCINSKKIIVFDVCGTLYDSNTTIDFVLFILRSQGRVLLLLKYRLLNIKLISYIGSRVFRYNLRDQLLLKIDGLSVSRVNEHAVNFIEEYLSKRQNKVVFDFFKKSVESSEREVYLASASINPIIDALSSKYCVKSISSTLFQDASGCYDGRIRCDISGKKDVFLKSIYDVDKIDEFYSDNIEDIPISQISKQYFFVCNGFKSLVKSHLLRNRYKFTVIRNRNDF